MPGWLRPPALWAGVAGVCLGAVAAALVSQHRFDMQPCPWCTLQRLVFLCIAAFALLGLLWRGRAGQFVAALGVDLFATLGAAAALWQHFVAANSSSCNLTLADKILSGLKLDALAPEVFEPRASCAEAKVNLLGLPYEYWSLALFLALGAVAVLALLQLLRAPRSAFR